MQLILDQETQAYIVQKLAAAGFSDASQYVIRLNDNYTLPSALSVESAIEDLRRLRAEVPRMTSPDIVRLVAEGREQCPQ